MSSGESWSPQTFDPEPAELAREMKGKRGVRTAHTGEDCEGPYVLIVLEDRYHQVPEHVTRPIYRRGLALSGLSRIAGRSHIQLKARPVEGQRLSPGTGAP